jgi:hypothetical protein
LNRFRLENQQWPENATPGQFRVFGRLVANEEVGYTLLGKEWHHLRASLAKLFSDFVPFRDYVMLWDAKFYWDELGGDLKWL